MLEEWRDYERDLLLQDPALASEEARRLHTSGEMDSSYETSMARLAVHAPQETAPTVAPPAAELDVPAPQHPIEDHVAHRRSACLRQPKREAAVAKAVAVYENENRVVRNRVRRALVLRSGTSSVEKVLQHINRYIQESILCL